MRRYTASRENEEIEAMFPVLKKADCRRKKKKSEMRASERVRARCELGESGATNGEEA
jgi:hypothetical protein